MLLGISLGIGDSFSHDNGIEISEEEKQQPHSRKSNEDVSDDDIRKDDGRKERIIDGSYEEKQFDKNKPFKYDIRYLRC